jgi:hypothetical protein
MTLAWRQPVAPLRKAGCGPSGTGRSNDGTESCPLFLHWAGRRGPSARPRKRRAWCTDSRPRVRGPGAVGKISPCECFVVPPLVESTRRQSWEVSAESARSPVVRGEPHTDDMGGDSLRRIVRVGEKGGTAAPQELATFVRFSAARFAVPLAGNAEHASAREIGSLAVVTTVASWRSAPRRRPSTLRLNTTAVRSSSVMIPRSTFNKAKRQASKPVSTSGDFVPSGEVAYSAAFAPLTSGISPAGSVSGEASRASPR